MHEKGAKQYPNAFTIEHIWRELRTWSDTVNTASRMESSGEVGKVNISGAIYAWVKDAGKVNGEWPTMNSGPDQSPVTNHQAPAFI